MNFDQSAYCLEFFNFTPEQISVERDYLVKTLFDKVIESIIKKIETPATSELLTKQKAAVNNLMLKTCQMKLRSLRELDKRTFTMPAHVLQIRDFELKQRLSSTDEQAKAEELEKLKSRYRENMVMLSELEAENEKYTSLEPLIKREQEMHEQIYAICANSDFKNIHKFATQVALDNQP